MTDAETTSSSSYKIVKTRFGIVFGLIVLATLCVSAGGFWLQSTWLPDHLVSLTDMMRRNVLISFIALYLAWTALMMTAAPLGSVTVTLAGFIFGPIAGGVQHLSQITSSALLYVLIGRKVDTPLFRHALRHKHAALALKLAEQTHARPYLGAGILRLIPIIPSCLCVLGCRFVGIGFRPLMVTTMLLGWIRPVFFAWTGSQIPTLSAWAQTYLG